MDFFKFSGLLCILNLLFSGHSQDSSQKECVLIIDQTTGEITLEKLSSHMRLKKTRQERPEKSVQIEKMINSGSTATMAPSSNIISTNNSNSSRPQTPVSAFKRDSPGSNNINMNYIFNSIFFLILWVFTEFLLLL